MVWSSFRECGYLIDTDLSSAPGDPSRHCCLHLTHPLVARPHPPQGRKGLRRFRPPPFLFPTRGLATCGERSRESGNSITNDPFVIYPETNSFFWYFFKIFF